MVEKLVVVHRDRTASVSRSAESCLEAVLAQVDPERSLQVRYGARFSLPLKPGSDSYELFGQALVLVREWSISSAPGTRDIIKSEDFKVLMIERSSHVLCSCMVHLLLLSEGISSPAADRSRPGENSFRIP